MIIRTLLRAFEPYYSLVATSNYHEYFELVLYTHTIPRQQCETTDPGLRLIEESLESPPGEGTINRLESWVTLDAPTDSEPVALCSQLRYGKRYRRA